MNVFYVTIRKDSLEMHGRLAELSYLCTVKARQDARTMRLCAAHYFFVIMTHFVNGDNASFMYLLKGWQSSSASEDVAFYFSSKWKWLAKVLPPLTAAGLVGAFIMFVLVAVQDLRSRGEIRWGEILPMLSFPIILFYIMLPVTYYHSFIKPRKMMRKVDEFMATYLPDIVPTSEIWPDKKEFEWKGTLFALWYYTGRERKYPDKQTPLVKKERVEIIMRFEPEENARIFDEKGGYAEEFVSEFVAFCKDKPACHDIAMSGKTLRLNLDWKAFRESPYDLGTSLDMLIYIAKRFHLVPKSDRLGRAVASYA